MNNTIEERIISSLASKIKDNKSMTTEEKERLITIEIERENYLKEAWQKEFAQKRIIKIAEETVEQEKSSNNQNKGGLPISTIIAFIVGSTLSKILYPYNYKLTISLLLLGVLYLIGFLIGKIINKKEWQNKTVIKFITWLNIISWLSPLVGVLTSSITLTINGVDQKLSRRYKILGFIALLLSVFNGILFIF
jgi:hypothetical protein